LTTDVPADRDKAFDIAFEKAKAAADARRRQAKSSLTRGFSTH